MESSGRRKQKLFFRKHHANIKDRAMAAWGCQFLFHCINRWYNVLFLFLFHVKMPVMPKMFLALYFFSRDFAYLCYLYALWIITPLKMKQGPSHLYTQTFFLSSRNTRRSVACWHERQLHRSQTTLRAESRSIFLDAKVGHFCIFCFVSNAVVLKLKTILRPVCM